ncbi:hypothetical protein LDENG_00059950, partial [Lucifuga dentata]
LLFITCSLSHRGAGYLFCSFLSVLNFVLSHPLCSLPVPFSDPHLSFLQKYVKNNLVKLYTPSLFHLCVCIILDLNYRNVSQTVHKQAKCVIQ